MSRFHQRRDFLRHGAALGGLAATPWGLNLAHLGQAVAQTTTSDYKALVCIFLSGGNDAHNTVIPTDAVSWRCYQGTRDPALRAALAQTQADATASTSSLALPQSSLLGITHANKAGLNTGRTFALNPQLKQIKQIYASGKAAIVANVGPLIRPTAKYEALTPSFPLPAKLYSHNDQTSTWQSFQTEGATGGWGGRFMDSLGVSNGNGMFSAVGVGAPAVWLAGNAVIPYQIGNAGVFTLGGETGSILGSAALYQGVRTAAGLAASNDPFAQDYARVINRAISAETILKAALPASSMAPWGTAGVTAQATDPLLKYTNPNTQVSAFNPLAAQLQLVARMIAARNDSRIGAKRQVFMVQLGGFDTHSNQMTQHADLLAKLDHAIGYFYNVLGNMPGSVNMRSQVTTFTASEFGRALLNNGDGTDHGWGGHHFVIGDAVKGADVYGAYPDFRAFDGEGDFYSQDLLAGGILLPQISLDQYVYTLGRWMGVADVNLKASCPNLANFDASSHNIGFLG
ncbi:MAG: hypothetical protein RI907_1193 [Pseudomonadota bacterium]|jgi:uncharacterized protein (DUF1501 family)